MNKNTSKKQLLDKALLLHSQGNIKEATKYYQYFIDQGFKDCRVFSNYGTILNDSGKLTDAVINIRKAIELNPNFSNAHYNLAIVLKKLGKLKEAEISIRKAIKLNPYNAIAYSNLGDTLKELGKLKEAEISIRKAIKLNPDLAIAYLNLGNLIIKLGKLKEAEISIRKAIKLNPDFAMAHSNLGNVLRDLGKLNEAEIYTRKAIELNPDFLDAYPNLGYILMDLGKLEELLELSESILESRSINQGYKLLLSVQITIANFLKKDFSKTLSSLNEISYLINQGAFEKIKGDKNKKYSLAFYKLITSLHPLLKKENINNYSKKIPHFGESHCLSFAHQTISLSSQLKTIQPVLITGGKAWHFANDKSNKWKDSLNQQIKNHNYSNEVFISFGEIDCRKYEGILNYAIKEDKNIAEISEKTIKNYLDYMEEILSQNYSKRYYFGIPAPTRAREIPDDLDIKRIKLIRLFNLILKKEVLSRDSYFLDVYKLTSNNEGINNNTYMCDTTHLTPKCLPILFKNYLYKI